MAQNFDNGIQLEDIPKIENVNNLSINVFEQQKNRIYPIPFYMIEETQN